MAKPQAFSDTSAGEQTYEVPLPRVHVPFAALPAGELSRLPVLWDGVRQRRRGLFPRAITGNVGRRRSALVFRYSTAKLERIEAIGGRRSSRNAPDDAGGNGLIRSTSRPPLKPSFCA